MHVLSPHDATVCRVENMHSVCDVAKYFLATAHASSQQLATDLCHATAALLKFDQAHE